MAIEESLKIDTRNAKKSIDDLVVSLKEAGKAAGLTEKEIEDMVNAARSGASDASKQTKKMSDSFTSLGSVAKGAGIAVAGAFVLDKLIQFGKYVVDIEKKFTSLRGEIGRFSGLTGTALNNAVSSVDALSVKFDKDVNEVLLAANAFSKQFGIDFNESLALIEKGFISGADASGDFLDKVREYPIQFKEAGFTAEEFIKIATQEVKGGIYSDKLLDTIKELGLSLRELTKAQTDALEGAFGKDFTANFTKQIQSGAINTKQALELISKEAGRVGLNVQQTQTLVADLFKGAGEDAGGFANIVKQVNLALSDTATAEDELEKRQRIQLQQQKDLSEAQNALSISLGGLSESFSSFSTIVETEAITALNSFIKLVSESARNAEFANAAVARLAGKSIDELIEKEQKLTESIQNTKNKLSELEKEGRDTMWYGLQTIEAKTLTTELNQEVATLELLRKTIAEKKKEEESSTVTTKDNTSTTKDNTTAKSNNAKATKDQAEALNKLSVELKKQAELAAVGGEDTEAGLEILRKREQEALSIQLETIAKRKDVEQLTEDEIAALKLSINEKYETKKVALNAAASKSATDIEKERLSSLINEEQIAFETLKVLTAQAYADQILTKEEYEVSIQQITLASLEAQRDALLRNGEDTLAIEAEIAAQRIAINETYTNSIVDHNKLLKDSAEDVLQKNIEMTQSVFDAVSAFSSLFGEVGGKIAQFVQVAGGAILKLITLTQTQAQADTIAAGAAGTKAISQAAATPFPANIAAIAATVTALISGISTITNLVKSARKFATGTPFLEGPGTGTSDSIPAMLSRGERVVPAKQNSEYWDVLEAVRTQRMSAADMKARLFERDSSNNIIIQNDITEIANAVRDQKKVELRIDEDGFSKRVYSKGNLISYTKNRFQ